MTGLGAVALLPVVRVPVCGNHGYGQYLSGLSAHHQREGQSPGVGIFKGHHFVELHSACIEPAGLQRFLVSLAGLYSQPIGLRLDRAVCAAS